MAISSCDEDTLSVGNTLTSENDVLDVSTSTFMATTRTIVADSVLSLSTNCYLGKVKDPETGAVVASEFSTQFHLLETTYISPDSNIVGRTVDNKAAADSCEFILYLSSPFKPIDSLTAMKIRVLEMDKPVEFGKLYYSNFDPVKENLIRTDGIRKSKMFTYKNLQYNDSLRGLSTYSENIRITLNEPYTAKDGQTYNNYGTYVLQTYYNHPEYFSNSYTFSHHVCPGFFFEIADGLGFYSKVSNIGLRVFYGVTKNDSSYNAALTLAGTKEVQQTSRITNDLDAISALASETGHTYLKSPAGLFTEVTLPVDEIKGNNTNDSLLAAKITFQRLNNKSQDSRLLGIPASLLMVQKDSLNAFFEKMKVTDSKTSYLSSYSSTYNTYSFSNISSLITEMWNAKKRGGENWTARHPDWNKVVLVPVSYTSSTSSTTPSRVEHDMSLTSTRLVGGTTPIEISVVYAKFH